MHYDLHLRHQVREQIASLAETMKDWEEKPRLDEEARQEILRRILPFSHGRQYRQMNIAGVDGSGDYPALSYADSFVYFSLAQGTAYKADPASGLREIGPLPSPVFHFTWLPSTEEACRTRLDEAFSALAGHPLEEVIAESDYRELKSRFGGDHSSPAQLRDHLIRPKASDIGNLAIQLRSCAELGAALRLLESDTPLDYLLMDGTLVLPFVTRAELSLFQEHLRRLCCVRARQRNTGFFALSKSHGLPDIEVLDELVGQVRGEEKVPEHWALRMPVAGIDDWYFPLLEDRNIPPAGTVTFLIRLHRNVPVMRLDMDRYYWEEQVRGETEEETRANEQSIFEDLDYASHDQRCYGYPYPLKAGHDRASLTRAERLALRKQIIDAAVRAGMKRRLFRDVSLATGHK